jgi:hypothetical protein
LTASAAMVKAMVVKGAGAGMGKQKLTCEEICASFDPPIEFGSHKDMVGSKKGYQAEHIVPTSAFHEMGRSGDRVTNCSGYTTPNALTWMARDGQSADQEHKILTDQMREFSQANDLAGREATLNQWLDEYEEGAKNALKNADPKRKIKNKKLDEDSLIDAAAECIRARAAESFAQMKPPVKGDTKLRNPWAATAEQRAAAAPPPRAPSGGRGGRR